jgi:hypothetical protein
MWISRNKVPCMCTFELCRTPITPYNVFFGITSLTTQILLVQGQNMLDKQIVMGLVIKDVIMSIFQDWWTFRIFVIKVWIYRVGHMDQDANLEIVPVHILHLILCLENIVIWEVNVGKDCIFKHVFQKSIELLSRPKKKTMKMTIFCTKAFPS